MLFSYLCVKLKLEELRGHKLELVIFNKFDPFLLFSFQCTKKTFLSFFHLNLHVLEIYWLNRVKKLNHANVNVNLTETSIKPKVDSEILWVINGARRNKYKLFCLIFLKWILVFLFQIQNPNFPNFKPCSFGRIMTFFSLI